MTDTLTPEQRHHVMAAIHGKDTKPEKIVRQYLWHQGYRYRLNHPRLPGKPDIVLLKYRTCIFVNGCFWHGHEGCKSYVMPKSNTEFWEKKILRNQTRDRNVKEKLAQMGWHCITVWECALKSDKRQETLQYIEYTLNDFYLKDHTPKPTHTPTTFTPNFDPLPLAAEESENNNN